MDVPLSKRLMQGVVLEEVQQPDFACESISAISPTFYTSKVLEIAKFISEYYVCSLGEALALFTPHTLHESAVTKPFMRTTITLSKEQQNAYDFIESHTASLLFGDTGSGKTEIYMKLFEACIAKKEQAIFLLPEIGLTPQMKQRLKAHFGEHVAIWHSKITAKKKEAILQGIQEGKICIVAGTRSALFLPLERLGLIVVDEEHDESYKSGSRPRYNAKDVSLVFGQKLGCKVVLGSATPNLASFHKMPFFRLKGTFFDSKLSIAYDEGEHGISDKIVCSINKALSASKQVVVFLPTRANF